MASCRPVTGQQQARANLEAVLKPGAAQVGTILPLQITGCMKYQSGRQSRPGSPLQLSITSPSEPQGNGTSRQVSLSLPTSLLHRNAARFCFVLSVGVLLWHLAVPGTTLPFSLLLSSLPSQRHLRIPHPLHRSYERYSGPPLRNLPTSLRRSQI